MVLDTSAMWQVHMLYNHFDVIVDHSLPDYVIIMYWEIIIKYAIVVILSPQF